jgi:hypothetical protein
MHMSEAQNGGRAPVIEAVFVASGFRSGHQRYDCQLAKDHEAVRFICGRCGTGTVSGAVGDTCTGCGARVVEVRYDTPAAANDVF